MGRVGLHGTYRLHRQPLDLEVRPDVVNRLCPASGPTGGRFRVFPVAPNHFLDEVPPESGKDVLLTEFRRAAVCAASLAEAVAAFGLAARFPRLSGFFSAMTFSPLN